MWINYCSMFICIPVVDFSFYFNQLTQFSVKTVKHNINELTVNISESTADTELVSNIDAI